MALYQTNAGDRILAADINQFYNILKGVAASGEAISLIYNAAGALILQPSSDPAAGTQLVQIKNNAGTVKSALTSSGGALYSDAALWAKSSDIASATTTDLSTATGNFVHITGTTPITGFGTVQAGAIMALKFDGILTLTHNGTSLILRGAANVTTAAGDVFIFASEGAGNWREVSRLTGTTVGIGTTVTAYPGADVTITTTNATNITSVSLPAGTYLVTCPIYAWDTSGVTNFLDIWLGTSSASTTGAVAGTTLGLALGGATQVPDNGVLVWVLVVASTTTYYFNCQAGLAHTSVVVKKASAGTTINNSTGIVATRIL